MNLVLLVVFLCGVVTGASVMYLTMKRQMDDIHWHHRMDAACADTRNNQMLLGLIRAVHDRDCPRRR